jgi:hypothetical protein
MASARILDGEKIWDGSIVTKYLIDNEAALVTDTASEINVTTNGITKKEIVSTRCIYHVNE